MARKDALAATNSADKMNMDGYLLVAWGLFRGAQQNPRADQLKTLGMPFDDCVFVHADSARRQRRVYCDSWDDRLVLMHVVVVDYVPLTSMVGERVSKPLRLPGLANRHCCNSLAQGHFGGEAGWHVTEDGV